MFSFSRIEEETDKTTNIEDKMTSQLHRRRIDEQESATKKSNGEKTKPNRNSSFSPSMTVSTTRIRSTLIVTIVMSVALMGSLFFIALILLEYSVAKPPSKQQPIMFPRLSVRSVGHADKEKILLHAKDDQRLIFLEGETKKKQGEMSNEGTNKQQEKGKSTDNITNNNTSVKNHRHVIPNNIIFTHFINLLTTPSTDLPDSEAVVLQANVQNTITLHPTAIVHFFTDKECIEAIQQAMNDENTPLALYFQNEQQGMYKADICRGAALYNLGGLYFDVDIHARMNIFSILEPSNIEFVTPTVHRMSKWKGSFFQAFIGVTQHHPIMKRYLNLFLEYYEGTRRVHGPLGVVLLRQAYDDVQPSNAVLWEEVKYVKDRFPDVNPTIGERRACHFVVAIPGTSIAPFYSRVLGSRMCGGKESQKVKE